MKKLLSYIAIILLFTACGGKTNGSLYLKTAGKSAKWGNSMVEFRTDMDSKDKRNDLTAFQAAIRINGKLVNLKEDNTALGYGASAPQGTSGLYAPQKGCSMAEVLISTPQQTDIRLHYDNWNVIDATVSLDKQIIIYKDSPIMKVMDYYNGEFEILNIAAGMPIGYNGTVSEIENGYAVKYIDNITAIIIMPDAEHRITDRGTGNVFLKKEVTPNQPLCYYIGISDKGVDYLVDEYLKIK